MASTREIAASNGITNNPSDVERFYSDAGPPSSYLGKYYCRLLIGEYKRTDAFDPSSWTPSQSVFLPLPRELSEDTSTNFNETSLQGVGDLMNGEAKALGVRTLLNGIGDLAEKVPGALGNAAFGSLGKKVAEKAMGYGGINAENITSAIQVGTGYAPNPNPAVMFTGPDLRELSFTWTITPRSADESRKLDRIVKILKAAHLPQHTIGQTTGILKYPKLCQINFFPWDLGGASNNWGWTEKSIIKIKKCFISNVKVNYTDYGNAAFFEGTERPIQYRITLSFREIEYMLSKDWGGTEDTGILENIAAGAFAIGKSVSNPVEGTYDIFTGIIGNNVLNGIENFLTGAEGG